MSWDPTKDQRYGAPGWTLIHPVQGPPYFVEQRPPKQRAKPRALRFHDVNVGEVVRHQGLWQRDYDDPAALESANDNRRTQRGLAHGFAIVEHRWFDPVAGDRDPIAGQLVAVRRISWRGLDGGLTKHTIRGLASQGYHRLPPADGVAVLEWLRARDELIQRHEAGEITPEEARAAHRPWRMLLADIGFGE